MPPVGTLQKSTAAVEDLRLWVAREAAEHRAAVHDGAVGLTQVCRRSFCEA